MNTFRPTNPQNTKEFKDIIFDVDLRVEKRKMTLWSHWPWPWSRQSCCNRNQVLYILSIFIYNKICLLLILHTLLCSDLICKSFELKKIGEQKQDAFFSINRIGYRNLLLKLLKIYTIDTKEICNWLTVYGFRLFLLKAHKLLSLLLRTLQ